MSDEIFDKIEEERQSLKEQKQEINQVIQSLKKEVITQETQTEDGYKDFRVPTRKSSMERAESIRAFVELHKLKTQLSKIIIDTYEREYKIKNPKTDSVDNTQNSLSTSEMLLEMKKHFKPSIDLEFEEKHVEIKKISKTDREIKNTQQ